ncbi:hypothetical protein BGZ79_005266, partial [Entomortierella chlamydospora]
MSTSSSSVLFPDLPSILSPPSLDPMTRYETQEPRIRSNSITAAWSYIWRGSKTHQNQHLNGNPSTPSTNKHQTITEDDDEDRVLGKGIARKVLPQQRRSTPSTQSSPAGSSRTSPRLEPSTAPDQQHQRQHQSLHPSALERIAIHNSNINNALASTMHHSMSLPPLATIDDFKDSIFSEVISPLSVQDNRPHYHTQLRQQQQQQHRLQPRPHSVHGRQLNVQEGSYMLGTSIASTTGTASTSIARDGRGSESADSTAQSNTTGAHRSSSPASCCSVSSISCPSPPS